MKLSWFLLLEVVCLLCAAGCATSIIETRPSASPSPSTGGVQGISDAEFLKNKRYLRKPVQEALILFNNSSSNLKKYSASRHLMRLLPEGEALPSQYIPAKEYFESIQDHVREFEAALPRPQLAERLHISKRLIPEGGKSLTLLQKTQCTAEDFRSLLKVMKLGDLAQVWPQLLSLPAFYADEWNMNYSKGLMKIAEEVKAANLEDLKIHYQSLASDDSESGLILGGRREERQKRILGDETVFMAKMRMSQKKVRKFLVELALTFPGCLRTLNSSFVNHLRSEITLERGKYFLRQLETYYRKHHEIPHNLEEFADIVQGDALYGSYLDEFGGRYFSFKAKKKVVFKSPGPDLLQNSVDDLLIGEFPVDD